MTIQAEVFQDVLHLFHNGVVTNFMEQCPWDASSHSASH